MTEVDQLNKDRESFKEIIELGEATERLLNNPDFIKVFLNHFMRDECSRNVQMSCDPRLKEDVKAACLDLAQAAGHVQRFLQVTLMRADSAKESLHEIDNPSEYWEDAE